MADTNNVVAPGPGIFAQLKQAGSRLQDPPESVLKLSHIKARRMEGRSYIYIWAIGVNPDSELPKEHLEAYRSALLDYIITIADLENLPVVVEVSTNADATRYENIGVTDSGGGTFKRIEVLEVQPASGKNDQASEGEMEQWYLMVRPQTDSGDHASKDLSGGPAMFTRPCEPQCIDLGEEEELELASNRVKFELVNNGISDPPKPKMKTPKGLTDEDMHGAGRIAKMHIRGAV